MSQSYGFSSSHVWIWELDCEESWAPKNWCFWTVVLEKTLESPLDYKEIQPVHSKGDQSWLFIGRTDAEAETPILWPPDVKNWLTGKHPDAGKDWGQEEKGTTEDEMVGWRHRLDGHEFEWTLRVGDGQEGLVCCSPWDCKESELIIPSSSDVNYPICCLFWLLPQAEGRFPDVVYNLSYKPVFIGLALCRSPMCLGIRMPLQINFVFAFTGSLDFHQFRSVLLSFLLLLLFVSQLEGPCILQVWRI